MNFNSSVLGSGAQLYDTLNSTLRYADAIRAWDYERTLLNDQASLQTNPSVAVAGKFVVGAVARKRKTSPDAEIQSAGRHLEGSVVLLQQLHGGTHWR